MGTVGSAEGVVDEQVSILRKLGGEGRDVLLLRTTTKQDRRKGGKKRMNIVRI